MPQNNPKKRRVPKLSAALVEQLTPTHVQKLSMERPGHPGQCGFMLNPKDFDSEEEFANIMAVLMNKLGRR